MVNLSSYSASIVEWLNDFAEVGVLITDLELRIRGWNRWFEERSGRKAADFVGKPLVEIFPELAARGLDALYRDALNGQMQVLSHRFHRYLIKLPPPSDCSFPEMQQTARVVPLGRDEIVGTMTVIEDVSARVGREKELEEARREAEFANSAKDRFLAVLSHDLRAPLSSIISWVQILQKRSCEAQVVDKGLLSIERNATVQMQLIEQILDIPRIASGKISLELEPLDVKDVVSAVLDSIQPLAEAKGVRLERILPEAARTTTADPKRFHQIVWNLLSNAVKFTPAGGSVRTVLEYRENEFQLSVADSGMGIAPGDLPHVFKAHWQSGKTHGHGGLGLGLAIVSELVTLHGGSIRAESAGQGQGATFTAAFPWSPAADAASKAGILTLQS